MTYQTWSFNMVLKLSSGHTVVITDDDTPETIVQKISIAQYIIDLRTDITEPLEIVAKRADVNFGTQNKKPKYKFNI